MTEEKKKDVRSFRITEEVSARFNAIKDELGVNQDGAMQALISSYELVQAENAIPERKTEISNFRQKARELVDAYLFSIQLNEDAEARIRAEFQAEQTRNQRTIDNYQAQIEKLTEENNVFVSEGVKALQAKNDLKAVVEEARKDRDTAVARLAEKDRLLHTLDNRLEALEAQAAGYPELQAERDSLAEQLRNAMQEIKDLQKDHAFEMERAATAAERATADAVAAAKVEFEKTEHALREQIMNIQMQAAQAAKADAETIRKLEQEKADLREKLAQITKK